MIKPFTFKDLKKSCENYISQLYWPVFIQKQFKKNKKIKKLVREIMEIISEEAMKDLKKRGLK